MQDKSRANVKLILSNVSEYCKCKTLRDLAAYLEIKESAIYSWVNRGSIGAPEIILSKCKGIRLEYLQTGKGSMLNEEMTAKIETATALNLWAGTQNLVGLNKPLSELEALTGRRDDVNDDAIALFKGMPVNAVPVISWTQAGSFADIEYPFQPGQAEQWVLFVGKKTPSMFALTVRGDSMEPEFTEGDIIVIDPDRRAETGSYVIVKAENENNEACEATFKQYYQDVGTVLLKPLNNKYPVRDMTGVKFTVVGVVSQKMKGY